MKKNSQEKRNQIIVDNQRLARHISIEYARRLDLDTLFEIADEKLFDCAETFDETLGKLGTYLNKPLRQAIRKAILDEKAKGMTNLPQELANNYLRIIKAEQVLSHQYQRHPTEQEIVDYIQQQTDSESPVRLDHIRFLKRLVKANSSQLEILSESRTLEPSKVAVENEEMQRMMIYVNDGILTPNEKKALRLYYGLGYGKKYAYGDERNLPKIAKIMGYTSNERPRQLVTSALKKLAAKMTQEQVNGNNPNSKVKANS